jgi:NAD(P)-dependent dehydrogenase (short-subunit alcohol dehydrogenase family)
MYTVADQSNRRFVITGANSGTGKEATKRIAAAGGTVVMAVRSLERGAAARDEILAEFPEARLELRELDLADLASVRAFAQSIVDDGKALDVLVNNAGVMAPPKRFETVDGFELQFGSNYLGPFALTNLLLPVLLRSKGARVTTMSSFVTNFAGIHFNDLQSTKRYVPYRAYGQSKLADMLLGIHLADVAQQSGWDLKSTIAHPGFTRTNLQSSGANLAGGTKAPIESTGLVPSQEVEIGTEPLLFAATDPSAVQGAYYGPSKRFGLVGSTKRTEFPRSARNPELPAKLWAIAEQLTGTALPSA